MRLRYRDEGRGPAVLFIHGWTLDLDMWEFQVGALASDFRVVRLDRRGFGLSSGVPSLAKDALDIGHLCRHLKLAQVALVGMSQGGRVAMQVANDSRVGVPCLVLDGTPEFGLPGSSNNSSDLPYEHYRSVARSEGMVAFRREWSVHPLVRLRNNNPRAHRLLARMIERYPGHDLLGTASIDQVAADSPLLHSESRPLLLVNGEHDLKSRVHWARQLATQLPQAEHVTVLDAGHVCNLDNPRAYNGLLKRFLDAHAT
ncbi:MAG TPA: alpha/beta hydrolase [Steroidobacteraceae bacterium]